MVAPSDIDGLPPAEPKRLIELLLAENAELKRTIAELGEEISRLKSLKGRPVNAGMNPHLFGGGRSDRRGGGLSMPTAVRGTKCR